MKYSTEILEEEEVLQTTTCTPKDIYADIKGWTTAFEVELFSFQTLDVKIDVREDALDLRRVTILPGKAVMVKKPNGDGTHKKKARVVVCGNFQQVQPGEETCANTPSFPTLRVLVSLASLHGWSVASWDVSTAFLYASLPEEQEVYCRPPKGTGGGGSRQLDRDCLQMTPQEKRQYDWYMKEYERADMTRDPKRERERERERERISMVMAALFPYHSHMPPERNERKVGKKKGLQGETPGESRDEIKTRTAAQKVEQQEQRVKAQQRALVRAAPSNVHHMSTRQKAQTKSGASAATSKPRTPSPSQSSSSESSSSSSTSSSPSKGKDDEQERKEVPEEEPMAQEPPPQEPKPVKPPSALFRLAKRLSRKTTVTPVPPSKEAQEAMEMPPPDIPKPKPLDHLLIHQGNRRVEPLVVHQLKSLMKAKPPHLRGEEVGHL